MTLANILSFSRIPSLFGIVLCLSFSAPGFATAAFIIFIIAIATDWLDGWVARRMNQTTATGALMDALIDKIFVLGLFLFFLDLRLLPSWGVIPLIIMMTREFLITGIRQCALLHHRVMAAEKQGKIKTAVQFLSLTLFMLIPLFQRDLGDAPVMGAIADACKFGARLTFALAALLTISSGLYYLNRYKDLLGFRQDDQLPQAATTLPPFSPKVKP
jgi:CDP-diacylglycerol--glycerol-3-phosphate 3-phosphatidyltransferase